MQIFSDGERESTARADHDSVMERSAGIFEISQIQEEEPSDLDAFDTHVDRYPSSEHCWV